MVQSVGQLLFPRPGIASKTDLAHKQNGPRFIQLLLYEHIWAFTKFGFISFHSC